MSGSSVTRSPRIAIVGPTHPYTGGIAQHTTRLAHELAGAGAAPHIESWRAQYPRLLYKGTPRVPRDRPEMPPFSDVTEEMTWYWPVSWLAAGRRLRGADAIALTIVTPFHAIPALVTAFGAGRGPKRIAIVHNVLPHEASRLDRLLMRRILTRMDTVLVHSDEQKHIAESLGVRSDRLVVAALPSPGIVRGRDTAAMLPSANEPGRVRLLFFGTVRAYKGLDILLRAVAMVERAQLLVAGDFWEPIERYERLAAELGIADRVELRPGYVDSQDIPHLFGGSDVLVMPYRSGTASIVANLARQTGRPVIVTDVGTLSSDVRNGVDGWVVPPGNVSALAAAISEATMPEKLLPLAATTTDTSTVDVQRWSAYTSVMLSRSANESPRN